MGMSNERSRNKAGRFVTIQSPSDALDAMEPLKPYMTGELAEILGWPRRSVYKVLSELADEGEIRQKKSEERRVILIRSEDMP